MLRLLPLLLLLLPHSPARIEHMPGMPAYVPSQHAV
jgi:hypothetical protein